MFDTVVVESFYFAHSLHVETDDTIVAATLEFGGAPRAAAIEAGHVCGAQFHPEKSQDAGLDLLARFVASTVPSEVAS